MIIMIKNDDIYSSDNSYYNDNNNNNINENDNDNNNSDKSNCNKNSNNNDNNTLCKNSIGFYNALRDGFTFYAILVQPSGSIKGITL